MADVCMMASIGGNTESPEVVRGKDDYLFLIGGNQHVLDYILGKRPILGHAKYIFKTNLEGRRQYASKLKIPYCHMICPDKHTVLREEFPYDIKVSVADQFKEYCGDLVRLPVDDLRAAEPKSFWKTDTHWNLAGQLAFALSSLAALNVPKENAERALGVIPAMSFVNERFCGDLGTKMTPPEFESGPVFQPPASLRRFSNRVTGNNGTIIVTINPEAECGRLLAFGDSFLIACLPLLGMVFREIFFLRSPYFHREIAEMVRPTHLLTANVERYLPNMPPDSRAPVGLLLANLLGKTAEPDKDFYSAMNALLQPGSENHATFMTGIGSATPATLHT